MEKLKILNSIVPEYAEKFMKGQYGLEEMPLLHARYAYFQTQSLPDLQRTYVIACQHLLQPQVEMFRSFIKLGLPSSHIWVLPKVYSANLTIADEIVQLGCFLETDALNFSPEQGFDEFHRNQCEALVQKTLTKIPDGSKVIVLDDGGMLLTMFARSFKSIQAKRIELYGVEQTASGKNILLGNKLPFLVTSVASSVEKIQIETGYIIRHSVSRVLDYFTQEGIGNHAKILVLGKGPIGKTLIDSLRDHGFSCDGYDVLEKTTRPDLSEFDVIIGATGKQSVSINDLNALKNSCHLISISSSDREFPSVYLRTHSVKGKKVHDTFISSIKDIHLANGGFPITFKAERIECYPLEIDVTMMKLFEGVAEHVTCTTEFNSSIQCLKFEKLTPLASANLYGLSAIVSGIYVLNVIFSCIIPGSAMAWFVGSLLLVWCLGPSSYFLGLYYNFTKLLPRIAS